jgi:hypothetical protein
MLFLTALGAKSGKTAVTTPLMNYREAVLLIAY